MTTGKSSTNTIIIRDEERFFVTHVQDFQKK